MAFDKIRSAELVPGKTVALKLDMLPGSPVVHVEHLGEENSSWVNEQIATANSKPLSRGKKKLTAKGLKEATEEHRKEIADHAIRGLDATHDDGTPATKADIPEFVASLPRDVVDLIWVFAYTPANWRDTIEVDAKELAEK